MATNKGSKKKDPGTKTNNIEKKKIEENPKLIQEPIDSSTATQTSDVPDSEIFSFFKDTGGILAAIGLIGAMISFLPSFAEKLSDEVWLGSFPNYQIAFLFLVIITGITFIFLLFLSIWDRYSETKYSLPFSILLLIFSIFLISFESFVYLAIQKYLYVNYVILVIYAGIVIFSAWRIKGETKRAKTFSFCCIAFLLSLFLINTAIVTYDYFNVITPDSTNTKIQTDVNYYNPEISQTYGIGFFPLSDKKLSYKGYNINWTTDLGYFFYIDSNINRIRYLGNTTTNHGEMVYWTYERDKIGMSKPTVNVSMIVSDQTNKTFVSATTHINWSSTDMAQVID
jgi:hypothetical protein